MVDVIESNLKEIDLQIEQILTATILLEVFDKLLTNKRYFDKRVSKYETAYIVNEFYSKGTPAHQLTLRLLKNQPFALEIFILSLMRLRRDFIQYF